MSIAGRIARLQVKNGETNYRLAKELGVHQTTVKNWKDGTCVPRYEHIRKIAEHFDVTVEELTGKKEEA